VNNNEHLREIRLGYKLDGDTNSYKGRSNGTIIAPPRRGKFDTLIAAMGLTCRSSMISIDPKGEAACVFGAHRHWNMGQDTWVINPLEQHKPYLEGLPHVGFNPMDGFSPDELTHVEKCDRLAGAIMGRSRGGDDNSAFFHESAKATVGGVIGGVVYLRPASEHNLVTVYDIIADPERFFAFVEECMATKDDFLVSRLARFACKSARDSKEVDGVLATIRAKFSFLGGRAVRKCLSGPIAFRWDDLRERPTTVFYTVSLDFADTCAQLSHLLLSDVLNHFSRPEPGAVPVVALCDEYRSTLANMPLMTEALSYTAGLGLQVWLLWQDINQIVDATSANSFQTMLACCGVQVYFAPQDNFTARYISDALGETEVITHSKTVSFAAETDWDSLKDAQPHVTVQRGQLARRLMLPQEVRSLSPHEMIVLAEDVPAPFIGLRRSYRETPEFKGLYGPNPFYPDAGVKAPEPRWGSRGRKFLFGNGRKSA